MAFGRLDNRSSHAPLAEINMVPLIDVMLVLLVIFIVTAPLLSHSVKVELPRISSHAHEAVPNKIEFAIQADGQLYWNGEPIEQEVAEKHFAEESKKSPQPELHIRADKRAEYQFVAETLASASKAGLSRIGFVSTPDK